MPSWRGAGGAGQGERDRILQDAGRSPRAQSRERPELAREDLKKMMQELRLQRRSAPGRLPNYRNGYKRPRVRRACGCKVLLDGIHPA